jgi:hypothetical protein
VLGSPVPQGSTDPGWWTSDRILAAVGLAVTVAGTAFAVWQLVRTKRAADAARAASEETKSALRAGDLRRVVEVAIVCRRRLDEAARSTLAIRIVLGDWVDAYVRIIPLLRDSTDVCPATKADVENQLEETKGHVFVARDLVQGRSIPRSLRLSVLDSSFARCSIVLVALLLELENQEVNKRVG